MIRALLLALLRLYQLTVSPYLGACCRFYPSCSNYAREAFSRHGLIRGFYLSLKRVCRCHPFSKGGVDRVPPSGGVSRRVSKIKIRY